MNGAAQFDWDANNIRHIARHGITPEEAEQVLANDPLELGSRIEAGEERFGNLGLTNSGRWLIVVTTLRNDKVRVVTAYSASKGLVDRHLKEKGEI